MNDFIQFPNPVTGLTKMLDTLNHLTFQDYLIAAGIIGVVVLWGLFSIVYLAVWPDLPEPRTRRARGAQADGHANGNNQ